MNKQAIILSVLMIIAILGAVMLVGQNQDTRKGAAFANTTLSLLPSENIEKYINDSLPVQVWYTTESGAVVDGVQTQVCYGNELELRDTDITVNTAAGFSADPIIQAKDVGGQKCMTVVVTSNQPATELKTTDKAFTLNFKAISAGEGDITIVRDASRVTGDNSEDAIDKAITVTSVTGTSYKIKAVVPEDPAKQLLRFRMSFYGINVGAMCAEPSRMPLTVTVRANDGTSEVYTNIIPTKAGVGDTLAYYDVRIRLTNNITGNFAVFVKGPKHLQAKFGENNQQGNYDKANGELLASDLTNDETTTKMYNFEKNPLLSGDVVSGTETAQDGIIDGHDFSYVKGKSIDRTEVDDGGYMLADLNGDCKMQSQDLVILMLSLKDKQEQLY